MAKKLREFKLSPRRYCLRCGSQCINTKGKTTKAFARIQFNFQYMNDNRTFNEQDKNDTRSLFVCMMCFRANKVVDITRHGFAWMAFNMYTGEPYNERGWTDFADQVYWDSPHVDSIDNWYREAETNGS